MVRVTFTQLNNNFNEKNTDYFEKAKQISERMKNLIIEEYETGYITLNLAIPHKFFHVTEISEELESSFSKFVKYKFDGELSDWIV